MEKINYQGVIKEEVNHPEHYQGNGIEVIDIIDSFDLNFNLGNSIKYILRADKKGFKKKDLDKKAKVNHYLSDVKKNYSKYYNHIVKEKKQQYNALLLLQEYMDDLMKTEKLVDDQLRVAKHDQKDIIREIDKVKDELDELIE